MDLSNVSTILGILGAYFAILLVLSVSVETILEPFTTLPWLSKKPNPDDILEDIRTWIPGGSKVEAQAIAVQNLTTEFKTTEAQLESSVKDLKEIADQALEALGPDSRITQAQKELALKLAALRRKYSVSEKQRITILRVVSAVIGIVIAILLKIDTFDILGVLFPPSVQAILTREGAQIGGMAITGLSASAGSSFWHDMLGRVRNLKEAVQQIDNK